NVFVPRPAKIGIGLVCGTGLAGCVFELLTMAHLLRRHVVIGVWIALLVCVIIGRDFLRGRFRRRLQKPARSPDPFPKFAEEARRWETIRLDPEGIAERAFWRLGALAFAIITVLTLLHALGEPETYWDSLILYMGYAREIFYQGCFPYKVVGQVG